jgi:hypothetical protein
VREQLLTVGGVLVWADPVYRGKTRVALDPLLRDLGWGGCILRDSRPGAGSDCRAGSGAMPQYRYPQNSTLFMEVAMKKIAA